MDGIAKMTSSGVFYSFHFSDKPCLNDEERTVLIGSIRLKDQVVPSQQEASGGLEKMVKGGRRVNISRIKFDQ